MNRPRRPQPARLAKWAGRPVRRRLDAYILRRVSDALAGAPGDQLAADILRRVEHSSVYDYICFGERDRLTIGEHTELNDAMLNTSSGTITIGDYTFFGHGVSLLTGTHDIRALERDRQLAIPQEGYDIVVGRGVWIASNAIVLGPCRIGDHAVVAAGSVVRDDVPELTVVGGVPARPLAKIDPR